MSQTVSNFLLSKLCLAVHVAFYGSGLLALSLHAGTATAQSDAETSKATIPESLEKPQAVIVTGTRRSGLKAIDSASPIQVLDAGALERAGQPDLIQALAQNIPSFTAQAIG